LEVLKLPASTKDPGIARDAMRFIGEVCFVSAQFPQHHLFGLSDKLHRAVWSISCDIAQSQKSRCDEEFRNRLLHASNTLLEVQSQLMIANELQYISKQETQRLLASADALSRRLSTLMKSRHNLVA
jgi:four helix bundle protein